MHSPLLRLNVVPRSNVPLTIDHCCGMIALSISPLIGYYQATVSFVLCKLNKRGGRRRNERKRGRSYDAKGRRIVGEEWRQLDRIQYKTTNASFTPSNHHSREFIMVDASIRENGYSLLFLSPVYVTDRIFFLFFFFPPFDTESCQGIGEPWKPRFSFHQGYHKEAFSHEKRWNSCGHIVTQESCFLFGDIVLDTTFTWTIYMEILKFKIQWRKKNCLS